jgi:hypothetical protein
VESACSIRANPFGHHQSRNNKNFSPKETLIQSIAKLPTQPRAYPLKEESFRRGLEAFFVFP